MTDDALGKQQMRALNRIALRAVWYPLLMQFTLTVIIALPLAIMLADDQDAYRGLTVLILLPLMFLLGWISAFYFVPKSLFKPRRGGQLVPTAPESYKPYRWRWCWIFLATNAAFIAAVIALSMAGVDFGDANVGVTFATIYFANFMTAGRMLKNGDATLQVNERPS